MPRITGQGSEQWTKRKDGRWTLRMRWSCASVDGGYRTISKSFHGETKAKCRELAADYRRQINTGLEHRGGDIRLGEYATEWHANRVSSRRYAAGSMHNEALALSHIVRIIGDVTLADVTPATARRMVDKMRAEGIGPDTVRKTATALHLVIQQAAEEQRLPFDVLSTWKHPNREYGRRAAMDPDTAARFRSEMMDEEPSGYIAAVLIAVSAGLRYGECCAITWGDVEFVQVGEFVLARLAVLRQYQFIEGEKLPKCGSVRAVWCDAEVSAWLKSYREMIVKLAGDEDISDVLVCTSPQGCRINKGGFNRWWGKWRSTHGYEDYVFHSLRHTMATLRIAAGVDIKTVQQDGGWKTAAVLLDTYAHSIPDAGLQSALAVSEPCQNHVKTRPKRTKTKQHQTA